MGRSVIWAMGLTALAAATPAWPATQETRTAPGAVASAVERLHGVSIADGEQVVLAPDGDGGMHVVSRGQAAQAPELRTRAIDSKVETLFHAQLPPITAAPDTLVASFRNNRKASTLKVENGFAHPMIYDASIVMRRGGDLVTQPTTICPIRARGAGMESWQDDVVGVVLSNPHRPPGDDMRCQGDAGLMVAPTRRPNVCAGGAADGPVRVYLSVDPASGQHLDAQAIWTLRDSRAGQRGPWLTLAFPMAQAKVGSLPVMMTVIAFAAYPLPKARTASIAVFADGTEIERRPWGLYAQVQAKPAEPGPDGSKPVVFYGVVPFPLRHQDGSDDPKLAGLFEAIAADSIHQLEVRVEGDDGSTIGRAAYALSPPAIRDEALAVAALSDAQAKAASPGHCAAPDRASP